MIDEPGRDDDDLLLRLEGGDERALTELFTWYRERLRRMIRLPTGTPPALFRPNTPPAE